MSVDNQASNSSMQSEHVPKASCYLRCVYQSMGPDALDLLSFGALDLVEVPAELQAHPIVGRRVEEPREP